jgi:hypothetical protein
MNLKQLIAEVNKDIDDSLANADITGWLNRALDDLSPYAKLKKSAVLSLVPNQKQYTLPTDLMEIVHIFDGSLKMNRIPMDDFYSYGYKQWGNAIIIQPTPQETKNLDLYYHARLPHLVNPDDVPAIPEEYHDLLVLYAVAKAKYQDEEESMQVNAMNEYYARREQFITFNQVGEVYQIQEVYW